MNAAQYSKILCPSLLALMLASTSAQAEVVLPPGSSQSGAVILNSPTNVRGGQVIVGFEGAGSATIQGGEIVLDSALQPPVLVPVPDDDPEAALEAEAANRATINATSPFFGVGEQRGLDWPDAFGTATLQGAGTSVVLRGNDNTPTAQIGNRGGTGLLEIRDGASLRVIDEEGSAARGSEYGDAIFVGSRLGNGTLLIDDASAEVVSTFGAFMFIGNLGATGSVTLRNGATVAITEIASEEVGNEGNGASIVVGRARSDEIDAEGLFSDGTGSLLIQGSNVSVSSARAAAQLVVGREEGTIGTAQLTDGSRVDLVGARSFLNIGQDPGALGTMTMNGGSQISLDGPRTFVHIGQEAGATGTLSMTGGAVLGVNGTEQATVLVGAGYPDFGREAGGNGTLVMTGADTRLNVNGNMIVGAPLGFGGGTGSGVVSVSQGATLQAGTVFLGAGGVLTGDGGIIDADVTLDGGALSVGASPGSMSIFGDLNAVSGIFDFEFAGIGPGQFDRLDLFGNLTFGDNVVFRFSFLDGFLPPADIGFNFLNVAGKIEGTPVLDFGTTPGLSLFSRDGSYVLAQSDPFDPGNGITIAPIPLPASALLLLSGLVGLAATRRRRRR